MVLERAEVERLVGLAEVDGAQVAGGAPAHQAAVGAQAGVVAAEARRWSMRRVASAPTRRDLQAELPGGQAELLDRDVADAGGPADVDLGDGDDRAAPTPSEACTSTTVTSLSSPAPHDQAGEGGGAARRLGHVRRRRPGPATTTPAGTSTTTGSATKASLRVTKASGASPDGRAEQRRRRPSPAAPRSDALGGQRLVDLDVRDPAVAHDHGGGPAGRRRRAGRRAAPGSGRPGAGGRRRPGRTRRGRGRRCGCSATTSSSVVGQLGSSERDGGGGPALGQPAGAVKRGRGIGGEGAAQRRSFRSRPAYRRCRPPGAGWALSGGVAVVVPATGVHLSRLAVRTNAGPRAVSAADVPPGGVLGAIGVVRRSLSPQPAFICPGWRYERTPVADRAGVSRGRSGWGCCGRWRPGSR